MRIAGDMGCTVPQLFDLRFCALFSLRGIAIGCCSMGTRVLELFGEIAAALDEVVVVVVVVVMML